jgi:CBS domain-containing protein
MARSKYRPDRSSGRTTQTNIAEKLQDIVAEIEERGHRKPDPADSVNRVMTLLTQHRLRHMPVLRGGKLAGIVSIGDVVKHRLEDLELETNVLRDVCTAAR